MTNFGLQAALALMWVPLYLFLAVYYLVFTLRERSGYNVYFAFLWFVMGVYAFASAGLSASIEPTTGVQWQRIQLLSAIFAFPTIGLFLATFAGYRPRRRTILGLYGISTIFAIGNFFTPWFFTATPSVKEFEVLGYAVRYAEMKPGWLGELCFLWGMVVLLVAVGLAARVTLQRRRGAVLLLIGMLMILATGINDVLVATDTIQFVYLSEHGFGGFAVAAALFMLDRFLETRADLERRSTELTAANRALKTLDTMKEDLLANISHELRTPLVSIRGYAEIMLEGKLGPVTDEQSKGLRIALRNVTRLLGLIGNLLDYAKLRDGRVRLKRTVLDLRDILRECTEAAAPQIEEAGLTLTRELSVDDRLLVRGDADKLRQVFDNLLGNAIKFTEPGGELRVELNRARKGWIRAAVVDTGIGIPKDRLDRIFERFYQVTGTAEIEDRSASSAGVGLAIVREIVRLHKGDVAVHSQVGKGSRFEIHLPRAARTEELTPVGVGSDGTPLGQRLLLVDDDREVIEFLSLALTQEDYKVEVARDGETALELVAAGSFDLMLLDLTMSGMGGVEVLERLRADPETAELPVIIVTALAGDDVRHQCLSVGADDFLIKPVAVDNLRRVVKRVLDKRRT